MKFGHLVECDIRNIFLKKSYKKCGGVTTTRSFSEILKFRTSLGQQSKVLNSLFLLHSKLRAIEIY